MLLISFSILLGALFSKTHCEEVTEVDNTDVEVQSALTLYPEETTTTVSSSSTSSSKSKETPCYVQGGEGSSSPKDSTPCPATPPSSHSHHERFKDIDWFKNFKIPFWFQSANRRCDFSSVTIPLLYFSYQTYRARGHVPYFDIAKFLEVHGLDSCCSSIDILSLLKELKTIGISKRGRYEDDRENTKGNLKVCEYTAFGGQHMVIQSLRKGPVLSKFNLQGLENYKGEVYRGEYCKGLRFQNAHKSTVLITGLKKDRLTGEFYFEALTVKYRAWGYKGMIRIAVKRFENGAVDYDGICGVTEEAYQFKV